ncbi:tRNA methyltransferase 44 [Lobosporangium transversale]|uniref:tRNA (uracil-O(2)-)-methyltransferase n=1 Tax=Lobosporangium transversale TaxID=64571 RepID=A0A1Y2G5W7_9FUNG|nr:hypothetical protein BCR41DRAFT_364923 [Lobosporangium transversale]KAF9919392.1 tRNA methyltransferase 44 [Lobosporangium transversale]ORY96081.1 hypothetical protein BCR41DRAFT_364923 [Lobosporangium transversale]|eukprot:XP_021875508.1 hypothetical protein BCR41DRAFT_364923 [Lobosporangium transversale]
MNLNAGSVHSKATSMSDDATATTEFVYDALFSFDDLPNRKQKQQTRHTQKPQEDRAGSDQLQLGWYQVAKAPVPFNEDVFWKVLERWILEAPSIIPPVLKVEILHDTGEAGQNVHDSTSPFTLKREQLLLDSKTPFRAIQRKLLPRRSNKDPMMKEQIYFVRSLSMPSSCGEPSEEKKDSSLSKSARSYAIFAPVTITTTSSSSSSSLFNNNNIPQEQDEIQIMKASLPFYYPKIRGFRYGYIPDPEGEESDDADEDSDHRGEEQYEYEDREGVVEPNSSNTSASINEAAPANKAKALCKRFGWITLDLLLAGDEGEFTEKMQYAFKELFKKLYKWGVNTTKGFTKSRIQHDVMVPKDLYLKTYSRLKGMYAQKWMQAWPEKTDPRKFVFEDIAIASWLVALWELEREDECEHRHEHAPPQPQLQQQFQRKQTFVDLGCGNGLLTHILNEEGHKGIGVDIVARKVWDSYGVGTQLEARTLIPNEVELEDIDWIIGNHADELAPWIPIIAMRAKPMARFVVIPCCFFDLNGSRYSFPKGYPEGKYKAYQSYICSIIEICGYELQTESLRIPSTKNMALVGMRMKKEKQSGQDRHDNIDAQGSSNDDCRAKVDDLVRKSGLFVARLSDKDKQALQRSKYTAKMLAKENGCRKSTF